MTLKELVGKTDNGLIEIFDKNKNSKMLFYHRLGYGTQLSEYMEDAEVISIWATGGALNVSINI